MAAAQSEVKQAFLLNFPQWKKERGLSTEEAQKAWSTMNPDDKNALIRSWLNKGEEQDKAAQAINNESSDENKLESELNEKYPDRPESTLAQLSLFCPRCKLFAFFVKVGVACLECGTALVPKNKSIFEEDGSTPPEKKQKREA
mmetsp:Transcript_21640/g.56194  ORF Transcript_21640/g.56194 Transcript_21640/m.56194 type:complete len:144 (-) Transcript_21640:283-714(-)|eukprot:CAMPEP_0113882890 /NCGR_PEP_ID=MMETSP0780_2-20120614/9247_1 /TAXON_ID=652834 /ORGANISM="Palpitomonas bilix" /LENGTH=143 /DNA_ID=CAMNT_0000870037 /DNA_START=188 /DNA_END=619 /DNA_ORIENTATION=- /assembly_acc=CAM_ASM_000599